MFWIRIRIQLGQWIRIWNPDLGMLKRPQKLNEVSCFEAGRSLWRTGGFFWNLDVLLNGVINKFLDQNSEKSLLSMNPDPIHWFQLCKLLEIILHYVRHTRLSTLEKVYTKQIKVDIQTKTYRI
jgi:hypothetical protein